MLVLGLHRYHAAYDICSSIHMSFQYAVVFVRSDSLQGRLDEDMSR